MVGSIETSSATRMTGQIEGRETVMLLDTGSAVTLLSAHVWETIRAAGDSDGFCELLEPESQFMECRRLAVAHSISRNKKGVTMAQVMNPNPTAVKIHKGEKVGKFQVVDEHHLVCDAKDIAPEELRELLHRFSDVISVSDTDIGRTDMVQHSIDTQNTKPIKQGPRRLPVE
ncbi:hypothetical protein EMCRGX_G017808 [Ephydatia muelleri]